MSTTGGPRLGGIGRVGNSNLVLALDAHDAGSYPGEPTTNYIKHGGPSFLWGGDGSNQSIGTKGAVDITDNNLKYNGYPTVLWTPGSSCNGYLTGTGDIDQTALSTVWTFSCYIRAQDGGTLKTSGNDLFVYFYRGSASYPSDSGTGTVVDAGDGWYRLSLSVSGTSNYAGLLGFSNFRAEAKFYLSGPQLEKKSYPTPFVTGLLNSGEVYFGRPATTNLMIDGKFTPSGGTITTSGDWTTHVFTSSGTFTPGCNSEAEILVVAGGGGGGSHSGGGGGAGGLLYYGSETPKTPNGGAVSVVGGAAYTVTVGAGGAGAVIAPAGSWPPPPGSYGRVGTNGSNSSIIGGYLSLTAIGGGGGGSGAYAVGIAGGSGGGGGRTLAGGAGTTGQGNAGSNGIGNVLAYHSGAGGGGAGATGTTGDNTDGGAGGVGLAYSISGSAVYYAGGGGGNIQGGGGSGGAGGNGGGGAGSQVNLYGFNATDNTGGGGGGGAYQANPSTGRYGNGGSGIVIIRYRTFQDSSPGEHTVTPNNIGSGDDPVHSGVSKFSGGSIYFNGYDYWGVKGSYLSVPDSTDWNFGTGDFTVDFWIRLETLGAPGGDYRPHQEIIGNYDNTSGFRVSFTYKGTGEDGIWLYGPGGSVRAGNITGWVADTWYHIAVVRSSGNVSIYKDGVLRAGPTSWATDVGDSGNPLIIGMDPRANPPANYPLYGYLDEIRVTKGTALWTSAFTPPTRRNLSAPVVDRSGNHNGINLINGTDSGGETYRVGEVIRPIDSAVLDFDGTDDYAIAGDSDDWNFGTEPFAIEQWLRFTDLTPSGDTWVTTLQQYAAEGDRNGWLLFSNNGGDFEWRLECTAPSPNFMPTHIVTGCSLNTWYLFTISREGSIFKMYIDGDLRLTDTSNPTFTNIAGPMYVGNYAAGDPHEFQGQMGALRIYKGGALTDQQVVENFNQQRNRFKI